MVSNELVAARRAFVPEPVYPETDLIFPSVFGSVTFEGFEEDEDDVLEPPPKPPPPVLDFFLAGSSVFVAVMMAPLALHIFLTEG